MRTDARIHHAFVEPLCIGLRFQLDRVVDDAGRAKVVVLASDRYDKDVVIEGALGRDLATLGIEIGRHLHLTPLPIDPDHVADAVAETVPVGLREVVNLVRRDVHAPGRDLVELRLPHMRTVSLDQGNLKLPLPSILVAETGREFQSPRSASDDHDPGLARLGITHGWPRPIAFTLANRL